MRTVAQPTVSVNSTPSALQLANQRLQALRDQWVASQEVTETDRHQHGIPEQQQVDELPIHLGWGSQRVARAIPCEKVVEPIVLTVCASAEKSQPRHQKTLSVQPSLLAQFIKQEVVAIGRVWLLARAIDIDGRGWLAVENLRTQLTGKGSNLRVCGWRRLRQILQQGTGVFWERDDQGRLWLYGTARVARNLDLERFSGDPIALPVKTLQGTVADVRAACYTAFHCGRDATPITRATLEEVTGVPERTQRHYDSAHNTERIVNFTLVPEADSMETFWEHNRAAFPFEDRQGKHGVIGRSYIAIRLPNSYHTTRFARLDGKQKKRLNRQLRQDLVHFGKQGNSQGKTEQIFFTDGKKAARVCNKRTNQNIYLQTQQDCSVVFWTRWEC